jgi:SAM-dependent methyltransferase
MLSRRAVLLASAVRVLRAQNESKGMFSNAEAYEMFMGRWSRFVAPLLIDFAGLPEDGPFLDAGSGTGALSGEIGRRRRKARVTGIDLSAEYVTFAQARNPFPDRLTFQVGDAQQLNFADGTFAGSLSLLVFNFIPEPEKALRELRRVTRPGGSVAAAVWDYYGAGMRMLRAFWDAAVRTDAELAKVDEKHMPLCRAGELSQLWKKAGLANVQEQPLDIVMNFASFADYWEPFLLGQGPAGAAFRKLSPAKVAALRDEVRRELSIESDSRSFALPARVWAVRGKVTGS